MNALDEALGLLPARIERAVSAVRARGITITEIRLRSGLALSVSTFEENLILDERGRVAPVKDALCATQSELSQVLNRLCEGSFYRHMETLKQGFLVTPLGLRAGVCGELLCDENGKLRVDTHAFSGINLRIPRAVRGAADALIEQYRKNGLQSTLIYAPPGGGKTTLLRDLGIRLSAGALGKPLRVAAVDERRELFAAMTAFRQEAGLLDVLSGYPKAAGIEIATRLFSPELILCDEIGGLDDPEALLSAQNSGALFCATAHAQSRAQLFDKPRIKRLISGGVFSLLCGIQKACAPRRGTVLEFDTP